MRNNEILYRIITHPLFVFPLFLIMLLVNNGSVPLVDAVEAANAQLSQGMLDSGDYIRQQALWSDGFRKAPLHLWLIALCTDALGFGEWSIRLPAALFSWGTLLLIYSYGRALYHERVAMAGAIICGTTFMFPIIGKLALAVAPILFFQTWVALSLISLLHWKPFAHILTFWLAVSGLLLTQGPIAGIFLGQLLLLTLALHSDRRRMLRMHPWFFLPLALLPLAYWGYLYHSLDQGASLWEIWGNYTNAYFGREESPIPLMRMPGFYLFVFSFSAIPFFRYFLPGIWEGIKGLGLWRKNPELLMLAIWMASGWLWLEFLPHKLPSHAAVALPPIALLMALEMIHISDQRVFGKGLVVLSLLEIALTLGLTVLVYLFGEEYIGIKDLWMAVALFALLPLASFISFIQQWRRRFNLSIYTHLILVGVFWLIGSTLLYPKMGKYWSGTKEMALSLPVAPQPQSDTVYWDSSLKRLPSLPYYARQERDWVSQPLPKWESLYGKYMAQQAFRGIFSSATKDSLRQWETPDMDTLTLQRHGKPQDYFFIQNEKARMGNPTTLPE